MSSQHFLPLLRTSKCCSNTLKAYMATLSHLVTAMAWATGVPRSKVFAYGRFAREGRLIAQKTRGPGAALMGVRDAANLLIAVCGTDITRSASDTIKKLRPLKGTVHTHSSSALAWLSPLGLGLREDLAVLKPDLGSFLEFLIQSSASGALYSFLSKIPFDRWPPAVFLGDKSRDKSLGPLDNMAKLSRIFPRLSDGKCESREMVARNFGRSCRFRFPGLSCKIAEVRDDL